MKVQVDKDVCIGSGNCEAMVPKVFQLRDGVSHVKMDSIPPKLEDQVREAIDGCPVQAITEI